MLVLQLGVIKLSDFFITAEKIVEYQRELILKESRSAQVLISSEQKAHR